MTRQNSSKRKRCLILVSHFEKKSKIPELISRKLKNNDIEVTIKLLQELIIVLENNKNPIIKIGQKTLEDYEAVFLRTVGRNEVNREIASIISRECKEKDILFFDKGFLKYVNDSKLLEAYLLNKNGISIPKTIYFPSINTNQIKELKYLLSFPMIIKKTDSQKGKDVHLIKNINQLKKFKSSIGKDFKNYIFQEYLPNNFDWRIYTIDNEIGFSITRRRVNEKELTNNISQGGKREFVEPTQEIKKIALRAAKATGITFAGVDIIDSEKKLYIIEVNRAPSFSNMRKSDFKRFDFVADYIINKLRDNDKK